MGGDRPVPRARTRGAGRRRRRGGRSPSAGADAGAGGRYRQPRPRTHPRPSHLCPSCASGRPAAGAGVTSFGSGGMSLNIAILGLSITSSWGNGHATTYRALVKALADRGHSVTFLERDVPWYRDNRDLDDPHYCKVVLYESLDELGRRHASLVRNADLVILGSYVPDGIAIGDWLTARTNGITAFYDIDTPVTLAGLERGGIEYISPGLIPRFDIYLSFSAGPALGLIEDLYGSPLARPLYCSAEVPPHAAPPAIKW